MRELANAVERAVILARGARSRREFVRAAGAERRRRPLRRRGRRAGDPGDAAVDARRACRSICDALERIAIDRALAATGGHRTRAAELLGISERTLRNKLNTPAAVD